MSEYESNLATVGCTTQSLVKCFSNSDLGVNLTTILIDMEPWFIAKEVATLLGYTDIRNAVNRNVNPEDQKILSYGECKIVFCDIAEVTCDDETVENIDNSGGVINNTSKNSIKINANGMKFINESGLYDLILESKKPEAKAFRRWVTSEVLPSIRKTGSYGLQIGKHDLLLLNISKAKTPEERALAISELEQYHEDEKHALKAENEQLEADNEILTQERDKAIATKAQISTNREAVAVGRVGGLVTANNRLKDELYGNRNRRTIKAVVIANHLKDKDISHYALIKYCKEHNLEIIKVPDTNWNEVNSYPIEAFKAVYPELIID